MALSNNDKLYITFSVNFVLFIFALLLGKVITTASWSMDKTKAFFC